MAYTLMLKEIRQSRGIKQAEMAERLKMPLSTYRTWEQGVSRISLETAYELAQILSCTPNDLCGWYLEHPEDRPSHERSPSDPRRRELVESYESLNEDGRMLAVETVASIARDPLRRADTAGERARPDVARSDEELTA